MAGAPPEGADTPGVGSWVTIEIGLPPFITDAVGVIRSVLDVLVTILNIALSILQVTKALLSGTLDPLSSLIESIIEEIEGLINDLRNLGLYVSGDWNLLVPDFEDLRGGYQAYERRMIGRLTNTTDPSRPDFSRSSAVIAIYLYLSVDISAIQALIQFVLKVMAFFGRRLPAKAFTTPVELRVTYGTEGATVTQLGPIFSAAANREVPDQANLQWQMAPSPSGTTVAFPRVAPPGFLIEVSTLPNGLYLGWDARKGNAGTGDNRAQGIMLDQRTGLPFKLYGGSDVLDVRDLADPTFQPAESGTSDTETRLYAFVDQTNDTPIPISALKDGNKHLLQRTFYAKAGPITVMGPGQGFSGQLYAGDMPYKATFEVGDDGKVTPVVEEQARDVYVRISAVTPNLASLITTESRPGNTEPLAAPIPLYQTDSATLYASASSKGVGFMETRAVSPADKSEPSLPLRVSFPTQQTQTYLETVAAALAVLVLSRSDLPVAKAPVFAPGVASTPTGLENIAAQLVPRIINQSLDRYFGRNEVSPAKFRAQLRRRCISTANYLYEVSGSMGDLEGVAAEAGQVLREWTFPEKYNRDGDPLTIWEALKDNDDLRGLALNPYSFGVDHAKASLFFLRGGRLPGGAYVERGPGFLFKGARESFRGQFGPWVVGMGSADMSPCIYARNYMGRSGVIDFCRNVFPDEVYSAAATVLNIAAAPGTLPAGDTEWIALRPFENGIPGVEVALDELLRWIKTIEAGIQSIVDLIVRYIEFVEARILELQALVQRIDGLLAMIENLQLPVVSGLVVTGNGTLGALEGLVTADNKPQDDADAYGAGVVILAGGLPAVLVDILQAFFPGGE